MSAQAQAFDSFCLFVHLGIFCLLAFIPQLLNILISKLSALAYNIFGGK